MGNYGPDKTPYLETFHAVRMFSLGGSEWGKFSWKQANILVFNEYFESGRSSRPEVFLEILYNSQENTCARASFLIKLQAETLAQVFSCEFCEVSKNTFFTEYLWTTVSRAGSLIYFLNCLHDFDISLSNFF